MNVGLHRTPDHKYQWQGGPLVPGITTVQGMKDKSGPLVGWAKRETAACAVRNIDSLSAMIREGGPESAQRWLASIPDYQRDSSADVGTIVHKAAEDMALGREPDTASEHEPFIDAYQRDFLDVFRPTFRAVEFMVFSQTHQYGGTGDVIAVIDGATWLIDYKTSSGVYAETALQLAALGNADWLGFEGDPKPYAIPRIDRYGVVHIRPERARLIPYDVRPYDFEAFLACRRLWQWQQDRANRIKGQPYQPSMEVAA